MKERERVSFFAISLLLPFFERIQSLLLLTCLDEEYGVHFASGGWGGDDSLRGGRGFCCKRRRASPRLRSSDDCVFGTEVVACVLHSFGVSVEAAAERASTRESSSERERWRRRRGGGGESGASSGQGRHGSSLCDCLSVFLFFIFLFFFPFLRKTKK